MPAVRSEGRPNRNNVTSLSKRVQTTTAQRASSGRVTHVRNSLTVANICLTKARETQEAAERLQNMSREERRDHDILRGDFPDAFEDNDGWEDDVLHGRATTQISHAGEALSEDPECADAGLFLGLRQSDRGLQGRRKYPDLRTRKNRTQLQVDAFARQIDQMADSYMDFGVAVAEEDGLPLSCAVPAPEEVQEVRDVLVVDMFSTTHEDLCLVAGDVSVAFACVHRGWMPVSPFIPTAVITIRALEVYRVARLRCPRLGIQAFVRTLCNIHGVAPRQWLAAQFSVAFDVYLAIRTAVDRRVQVALGRDALHWRLKNACPCCLYKLEGEPCLKIPLMGTFDGNNSLSRFWLREKVEVQDGTLAPGASKEHLDDRVAPGDYYLAREEDDDNEEEDGCSERWQNMKEDVTSRAYGMYDETGFFPALYRHGFVLKVVDMVKSGELSKYPLAITAHLLNVLGEVAIGYDIGCKFGKMVKVHPALKELVHDKNFRALVGTFHGHGHNRLCRLDNLMTYVEGVGLEALETCESFFSKSNALASTTRYASRFHRQQAITTYLKHTNTFDTYQGLISKYRRALEIKSTYSALRQSMRELGVQSRDEFETWRTKEKAHLRSLSKEPEQETLEMEYFQKLALFFLVVRTSHHNVML
ncbi:hypothetical protein B0H14DRAFT_3653218 [Mycena olivaceomarginata]|nr:hypothetical protein B0H14DRAFT_3653218 [Mycena olivaceomarginata]